MAKVHDPAQFFIVKQISRAEIAQQLNQYTEDFRSVVPEFAVDDVRLTDSLCREYAEKVASLSDSSDDWDLDDSEAALEEVLSSMGYEQWQINEALEKGINEALEKGTCD